jgi:hypothetical protein
MMARGGGGVRRYSSFLTLALNGGEWSALRLGRSLPPGKGLLVPVAVFIQFHGSTLIDWYSIKMPFWKITDLYPFIPTHSVKMYRREIGCKYVYGIYLRQVRVQCEDDDES